MQIPIGNEARTKAAHDINKAAASTPPDDAAATSSHTQRSTPLDQPEAFTEAMEKIVAQTMMKLEAQLDARIGQHEEHVVKLQSYVKELFEEHVVKLHSYVKDKHEEFGAQIRHMDSTIAHMDSRVSELVLDVRDLREFIHLYSTEFKEFAAYKASHHEEAGPSTHPGNESHSPAQDNVPCPNQGEAHEEGGSFCDTADLSTESPTTGVPPDPNVPEPSSPIDTHDADPVTQLLIVPLPEAANPPHAPSRPILDPRPLRFIPAQAFMSGLAAENMPHLFTAAASSPPQPPTYGGPKFIPVNLPGSRSPSQTRSQSKRSPAKRKKKN